MTEAEDHDADPGERALPLNLRRDQPLVPVDSAAGRALVAVIAILTFLAALSAGAALLAARASEQWRGAVANEMTLQIRPDSRRNIDADVARAVEMARGVAGIAEVRAVPKAESDRLLEPWLGTGLDLVELPVPRLIVLKLGGSGGADIVAFKEALRREVPTASLDDHRLWLRRLSTMANTIILAGVVVVLLVLTAAALAVAFATRGAMAGSRDSVEVLHLVGADDAFIAREFQSRFVRLGLKGGGAGGLAAIVAIAVLGWFASNWSASPESEQIQAMFGAFEIGWSGYGAVLLVAMIVAAISGLVSRFTVRHYLRVLT
ncbi:cell division protein FtsX [Bosea sp. (in: a-proteobacteria)]|jgi:cell division transport system permease protein|uniref:cell division protein FtsX n=1 Tax=Bosea sp. (in: a-proteobacteria) TaxID=1871050 RepID=UPI003F72EB0F